MAIIAGIDNGTQSTKVLIYDSKKKEVLDCKSFSHQLITRDDGTREQYATWWIEALKKCFDSIPAIIKSKIEVIGVSGQQHGFVPLSDKGEVLAPVKLWCDTSTQTECNILTEKLGGRDYIISIAGNEIKAGYTASKILALKNKSPYIYKKLAHILLPHDYINYILTDKFSMEPGDASGTGLYSIQKNDWSHEIINAIDETGHLLSCLPQISSSLRIIGTTTNKAAFEFGIPSNIPVSSGGGDNMMSAIGTGCTEDGILSMSMGTSGTIFGCSDKPVIDKKGRLAAFCSSTGQYLPLLCTMNCTVSSELSRAFLGLNVKDFDTLAASADIGSGGIVILPFFNGERTPEFPNGTGCIFGLTPSNYTKNNIARASMEASVFSLNFGFEAFKELGFKAKSIRLTGGGAKSSLWRQMVSNITGLEVLIPKIEEAAAFGACLQALSIYENKNIHEIAQNHVLWDESKKCNPNYESHKKYCKIYKEWVKYMENMKPIFS